MSFVDFFVVNVCYIIPKSQSTIKLMHEEYSVGAVTAKVTAWHWTQPLACPSY